jgi:predicted TIM-barrel fold metal-dependent hydrolase
VSDNLAVMDTHGIDIQLVSGVEAVTYDPIAGNRTLARDVARQPRLAGLFVIDPRDVDGAEELMDVLLPEGMFVGAKIHTDYSHTPMSSPLMRDALRLCAERDLPVLVHAWGAEILALADAVEAIPGLRAIAGHMGGPDWQLGPEAVRRTDRIWLEPCYSQPQPDRIRHVLDEIGPDRLLFGTDSTLIDPSYAIGAIRAAHLDVDEYERIMSGNAQDLFDLADRLAALTHPTSD